MEYYSHYIGYAYKRQLRKKDLDEKSLADKLEKDDYKKEFKLDLLDELDNAKEVKAISKKSRNAYLSDAILRAGLVLGPPIAGIVGASIFGDERHVAASIGLGVIYAGIAKLVEFAMVDPAYGPKAGVCWTLANLVPYYNRMVKTNGKFIKTIEAKIQKNYERKAESRHDDPNAKGFGP